jgi:hypothetical protein
MGLPREMHFCAVICNGVGARLGDPPLHVVRLGLDREGVPPLAMLFELKGRVSVD